MIEQPVEHSKVNPAELSLEELGLTEGEPLETSPRQMIFGWGLVFIAFVLAIGAAVVVITVLLFAGVISLWPVAFWLGDFSP